MLGAVTLWLTALAFALMSTCLVATVLRQSWTTIAAVVCVALTLLILALLSDVPIGVSL